MAKTKGQTSFKKGSIDFKQVLFNQLDRTMRCLTESNYVGFVDGVEGLYLILIFVVDEDFRKEDEKLFNTLNPQLSNLEHDVSLWPEDKEMMLSALGIQTAKVRLANLMILASRNRLLLERRRFYAEGKDTEPTDPTEEELEKIIGISIEEEQE